MSERSAYLRALQQAVQAHPGCATSICLDEPKHLEPEKYEGKDQQGRDKRIAQAVPNPAWKPTRDVALCDQAIANILNAEGYAVTSKPITGSLAKKELVLRERWRLIEKAADDDQHKAVEAAFSLLAIAADDKLAVDFQTDGAKLLADLLDAELIDADDQAAVQALCVVPSAVTAADVSLALRGPWGDEE